MTRTAAASRSSTHVCVACGHSSFRWFGRCPSCGEWSSAAASSPAGGEEATVVDLGLCAANDVRWATGIAEVDRVLGGGIVRGSVCLLAGEPGVGKSTLLLQVLDGLMRSGRRCLLVTGEESLDQTGMRARRLGLGLGSLRAAATTSLQAVLEAARRERPEVIVVDSVQTLRDASLEQAPGSVVQVRDCAAGLVGLVKAEGTAVVLVGHVTKDGSVAGPKVLEHVVDAVLTMEGERSGALRLIRAAKNRFGSCEETGVFTMTPRGLEGVSDPSAMLLADRKPGAAGSIVFPGLEGSRPLLVELQALVAESHLAQPRRVAIGVDARRMSLLLGIMSQRDDSLARRDVFLAVAGGVAVREPAADLALCLAIHSAARAACVPDDLVAIGEVGLAGEVRRVPELDRRLSEAARLGFRTALVPASASRRDGRIRAIRVSDLSGALGAVS